VPTFVVLFFYVSISMSISRAVLSYTFFLLVLPFFAMSVQAQNTYTVTNTNDSGSGSLRAAINNANDGSGTPADVIEFDISGSASPSSPHVIQPDSELPTINDPVVIDGSTDPDYSGTPVVELDGQNAGSSADGLFLTAGNSTVRALSIIHFTGGRAIASFTSADGIAVTGCHIGVRADGTTAAGNDTGLRLGRDAQIGGTGQNDANIIGGNDTEGVHAQSNATIQGNYIGTNPAGNDLGNGNNGIEIVDDNGVVVGGSAPDAGNVIAHNTTGIMLRNLTSPPVENSIRGNAIFANGGLGIDLAGDGQTTNDDGDPDDGANRLQNFPEIESASYDPGSNEVTVSYLVPSDPGASGSGASTYPLSIEFYRADADGQEGKALLRVDTYSASSPDDYAGCGSPPCTETIIFTPNASVTEQDSILATATDANGNTSEFTKGAESLGPNVFTVNATGDGGDPNTGDGICSTSGGDCTLRAAIQEANASPNNSAGPDEIRFDIPGSASPTSPHVIQPDSELPSVTDPVVIDGITEADHTGGKPVVELNGTNAGGTASGLVVDTNGSLIARDLAVVNFSRFGFILSVDSGRGNRITGCHVGVRADGAAQAANGRAGVTIGTPAENTTIGGSAGDAGNVISGNTQSGLQVFASATIQGNRIGVDVNGDPMGNGGAGLSLNTDGATIGGTGAGEGNTIAHNSFDGVVVTDVTPPDVENSIRGNAIFANGDLGINLDGGNEDADGVTANDDGDADDGQNRFQNFPEIQSAEYDASADDVTISFLVPSDPNASGSGASTYPLTVDFYKADADDQEGAAYLGTDTYSASSPDDYSGCGSPPCTVTATLTPPSGVSLSRSDDVVATATDANGNTSEFSAMSQKLPVEMASFEARQTGERSVRLHWQTASETGNTGFRVQHQGPSAASWSKMGFVDGSGTTTNAQSYQFSAEDLAVGTHQFRLQQVDLDGSTTLHDPVTVDLQMTKALRLSAPIPNPVQGTATASFAVKEQWQATVALYNVLGEKVATLYRGAPTAGEVQSVRIRTSDLASGVYFLRLDAGNQVRTQRLTVVR